MTAYDFIKSWRDLHKSTSDHAYEIQCLKDLRMSLSDKIGLVIVLILVLLSFYLDSPPM